MWTDIGRACTCTHGHGRLRLARSTVPRVKGMPLNCTSQCFRLLKPDSAESDDIRILRDIEQYYSTQIDEMPMNVADLI